MKKSLLGLLLAVALVMPTTLSFAKDLDEDEVEIGRNSISVKVGYGFAQGGNFVENERYVNHVELKDSYMFSIGYLYHNNYDSSGIGISFDYVPATEVKDSDGRVKVGFYNIYGTINPTLKDNIANTFSLYLPIHIGLSVPYKEVKDIGNTDIDLGGLGLYCGIGLGTTIKKSFIIELMYDFSMVMIDRPKYRGKDDSFFCGTNYGGLRLNIGYLFHFGKTVSSKGRFEGKE